MLKLWWFRSCSSSKVVDIPVFTQRLISIFLTVQKTTEIPQLLVDTVADILVLLVVQVPQVQVDVPVVLVVQVPQVQVDGGDSAPTVADR